jgi:hypothetical protein
MLFDYDSGDYYEDDGPKLVASRVNAGYVYAAQTGTTGSDGVIYFRRSTNGGVSWEANVVAVLLNDPGGQFAVFGAQNVCELIELADGRLVIIFLYSSNAGSNFADYVVSSDQGATWSTRTNISGLNEWIYNSLNFTNARLLAAAKGNDVMVTRVDPEDDGQILIFRP